MAQQLPPVWRQVRVFTNDTREPHWYFDFLEDVVRPWSEGYQGLRFYFSRYCVPVGPHGDEADTEFSRLPPSFLEASQQYGMLHRSIRVRFDSTAGAESELAAQIQSQGSKLWYSSFLDYKIADDLGGDRFSTIPESNALDRYERGLMVGKVLQANCELTLKLFSRTEAGYAWETNPHKLNEGFGNPLQSVAHMMQNVWWVDQGGPLELRVRNYVRMIEGKI